MANPRQDFAAGAQQYFSGEQSTTATGSLPLVGDSWVSGNPSSANDDLGGKEDEGLQLEGDNLGDDIMQTSPLPNISCHSSVNADDNIDPLLQFTLSPPTLTYSQMTASSMPVISGESAQPVSAGSNTLSTPDMLQALTSHAH
ncbi:hypothetical protein EDD17DRAFT_1763306 [Pisolithus thermaeus]|nr:hypothetical protein EDD17DRAFT_1763306 [Pisolithus thermaeus]